MFGRRKKMEKMTSMMAGLTITSKASLKQFCLLSTQCNVKEAAELYDFLIKDMDELPMFDPVKPTTMESIKATAGDIFSFIKENQDGIAQGVDFIKSVFSKRAAAVSSPNSIPANPLPPIN